MQERIWRMKICNPDIFHQIENGSKKWEVRAGRMPMNVGGFGKEKDWAQVKPGDRMEFEAIYPKPENKNPDGDLIQKRVGKIVSVSSLEVLLIVIPISEIAPSLSEQEYREMINSFDGYPERMEKFGVWAFELLPIEEEYNE